MSSSEPLSSNRTLERVAAILDAVDRAAVSASELARRTGAQRRIHAQNVARSH